MKKIKIFFAVFFAFAIFLVVLPFFLPQNTYKNWFIVAVEKTYPLDVEIQKFKVKFLPAPHLVLGDVKIVSKSKPFENLSFLEVKSMEASLDLNSLFHKQFLLDLKFANPLFYYRNQGALSNLDPIFSSDEPAKKTSWSLTIDGMKIQNGEVQIFKENKFNSLKKIDLSIKNLSFKGESKIPLELSCALLEGDENFKVDGKLTWNADKNLFSTQNLHIVIGNIQTDFRGEIDAQHLKGNGSFLAKAKEINAKNLQNQFPKIFSEVFVLPKEQFPTLRQLQAKGDLNFDKDGLRIKAKVHLDLLTYKKYPFEDVAISFNYKAKKLTLEDLSARLFGTRAMSRGILFIEKPFRYDLQMNVNNVDLQKVTFLKKQMEGLGSIESKLRGSVSSINGEARIFVSKGAVPALKLGQEIFGNKIWDILTPLVGFNKGALQNLRKLDAKVDSLLIPLKIENSTVQIMDGRWSHPQYQITLNGKISVQKELAGKGAFVLNAQEMKNLIQDERIRGILANSQGEFVLPFNVGGTFENPRVEPDKSILGPQFMRAIAAENIPKIQESFGEEIKKLFKPLKEKLQEALPKP